MFDAYIKWIEAHERLLLVAVAGLVLWFAIGKIDTLIANHDHVVLQEAQVVAAVQQEKNDAMAKQMAQQAAQYKELADKVQTQNAQLEQANVALVSALTKQQKVDASLPPSELANRWAVLVPQAKPTVIPTGLSVDNTGAVATVQQLELIPVQQQELAAAQTEVKNDQSLISASNASIATLNLRVDGLNLQIGDNEKVCTARVKVETDKIHKARRRWFIVGYIAGFLSRQYLKTATGF